MSLSKKLGLVQKENKDYQYWLDYAEKHNPNNIPDEFKTLELCKVFLKKYPTLLVLVPTNLITFEMYENAAIAPSGSGLQFVPSEFKTQELCLKAVQICGFNLRFVPEEFKDKKLCDIAFNNYKKAIQNIPNEFITQEMCMSAIEEDPTSIFLIPMEFRTKDLLLRAIEDRGGARVIDSINPNTFPVSEWKVEWFEDLINVELRRLFIKERGAEIFEQLDPTIIEEDNEYVFICFKYSRNAIRKQKALIYECPSSGNIYFTEVNFKCKNIKSALRFLNNGLNKEKLAYES